MSEQNGLSTILVGLDNLITVSGEYTTIRREHLAGHATGVRVNDKSVIGQGTPIYWALIDGQSFPVSAEDHAFLRGEPWKRGD